MQNPLILQVLTSKNHDMINLTSLLPVSRQKTWVQAFSEEFDLVEKYRREGKKETI